MWNKKLKQICFVSVLFQFYFTCASRFTVILRRYSPNGGDERRRYERIAIFDQCLTLSWKRNKIELSRPIVSGMDLSNGAIFAHFERIQPIFQGHAIIWHWLSQKWYKIEPWLEWNTITYIKILRVSFRMILTDSSRNMQWHKASRASLYDSWAFCDTIHDVHEPTGQNRTTAWAVLIGLFI